MKLLKNPLILKLLVWLLIALNLLCLYWLNAHTGSMWGWHVSDFSTGNAFNLIDVVAIIQFVLFALAADMIMRKSVAKFNRHSPKSKIPVILVQCFSILIFGLIGLAGFILLYDHSVTNMIAASGAIGLSIGYICKDLIADTVNSIVIQTDGLISIHDWIEIADPSGPQYFQVMQFDRRMVTLKNQFDYLVKIPNTRFMGISYVNLSKQADGRGSRRALEIQLDAMNRANKVLEILNLAMASLLSHEAHFMNGYVCGIKKLGQGAVTYLIEYECQPAIKISQSNTLVMKAILRFLTAAGMNTGTSMEIQTLDKYISKTSNRFLEVYEFSLLHVLDHQEALALSKTAQIKSCFTGQQLIKKGDEADSMFLLSEGSLEVKIADKQGQLMTVATLWPGDCVGEMSLLTGAPRSADVFACTDTVLVEIKKEDIAPILESNPRLIQQISDLLASRQAHNESASTQGNVNVSSMSENFAQKIWGFFFKKAA
jgi:CRP-like cAMP-binding protein